MITRAIATIIILHLPVIIYGLFGTVTAKAFLYNLAWVGTLSILSDLYVINKVKEYEQSKKD